MRPRTALLLTGESSTPPSTPVRATTSHPTPRELEWLAGIQAGRFDIFQTAFEYYTPILVRFARLSIPLDAAEDLVQDVMFNLWQLRDTLVAQGGLTTYLFAAVRNRVTSHLRHERIVLRMERSSTDEAPPGMGKEPQLPDSHVISGDFATTFRRILQRLSPMQREVITLRWEHEMSYEQIAGTLGISVAAAQQHGSRAQRIIRPVVERFLIKDRGAR